MEATNSMDVDNAIRDELQSFSGHLLRKYGSRLEALLEQYESFDAALAADPQEVIKCVALSTIGGDLQQYYEGEQDEVSIGTETE